MTTQVTNKLSFALPESFRCRLKKIGYEGSALTVNPEQTGYLAPGYGAAEMGNFEHLVSQANEQLRTAGVRQKWLVLIEEGDRSVDSAAVAEELARISPENRSEITRFYCLGGGEVVEIMLPPPRDKS